MALLTWLLHNASLIVFAKPPSAVDDFPAVSAQGAILLEASGNHVIYEKNAHVRLPMASTTKIMTAIVAIEYGNPAMQVTVPAAAVGIEGSSIYLYEGEILTLEHLLYALLLESANDAAVAIAIATAGSVEAFVDLMNQKAHSLGLSNTHFVNPHGLDHEEHYTTASDLASLARYCMQNELFRTIVSTQRMTIPLNDQEGARLLLNHNRLLRSYEGTIGLKTGFTKRSGRCLVSAAQRDGVTLISVTLNAPDDWDDHRNMFDYGFSQYTSVLLQSAGTYARTIPLIGNDQDAVDISNRNEIRVILPQTHGEIHMYCHAPRWMSGAISEGAMLGQLIYECDGEIIAIEPLLTQSSSTPLYTKIPWWKRLWLFITE
jgi:D-alanyl-D-alanine carboxypeptidase